MRAQFEPLTMDGYSYDPRTVAAALEALVLRAAITGRAGRDAGLAAVFLLDYEAVLDDRVQRVHSVAFEDGVHSSVCSCGLVMYGLDPLTASGHLDTDTWRRVDLIVVAHEAGARVACHACGWRTSARSVAEGHALGEAHDCICEPQS